MPLPCCAVLCCVWPGLCVRRLCSGRSRRSTRRPSTGSSSTRRSSGRRPPSSRGRSRACSRPSARSPSAWTPWGRATTGAWVSRAAQRHAFSFLLLFYFLVLSAYLCVACMPPGYHCARYHHAWNLLSWHARCLGITPLDDPTPRCGGGGDGVLGVRCTV